MKPQIQTMKKTLGIVILHLFILAVFVTNSLYVAYPDEHVNLLGGKAINQGLLPYKDFFDHHLPFAWELSAALLKLSFNNFVIFRVLWSVLAFVLLAAVGLYIRNRKPDMYPYYMSFFFLYPFVAVYFWLHLFIADALACLFFSIAFWITVTETWNPKSSVSGLLMASFATFLLLFSSLTFVFISFFLYVWQFYLVLRNHRNRRDIIAFIIGAAFPYLYFIIHLFATGSFGDFWRSNYVYNSEYYVDIRNYTPGRFFNPIKFGGAIIHNFYNEYIPLLSTVKNFDLYFPIMTLAAWSTLFLLIFFFLEDSFLFVLYFLILSFSAPRSTVTKLSETDYQVGLFIILGLVSAAMVLYRQKHITFKDNVFNAFKTAAMMVVVLFALFSTIFLVKNTFDKAFLRYIQVMPGISSRTFVSRFVDETLKPGEYYWVGPYMPEHIFPVKNGLIPGKYPTLLPQFQESDYYSKEFIHQFEKNPPVYLIFRHEASVFNTPADKFGKFFLDWMNGKYVTLEMIEGYQQLKSPTEFNLKGDLYMRVDKQEEILQRLMDAGYVGRL